MASVHQMYGQYPPLLDKVLVLPSLIVSSDSFSPWNLTRFNMDIVLAVDIMSTPMTSYDLSALNWLLVLILYKEDYLYILVEVSFYITNFSSCLLLITWLVRLVGTVERP